MVERAQGGLFGGDETPEEAVPTGAQPTPGNTDDGSAGGFFGGNPTESQVPTGAASTDGGATTDTSRGSLFTNDVSASIPDIPAGQPTFEGQTDDVSRGSLFRGSQSAGVEFRSGAQGPIGPQGPQGNRGPAGQTGPQGIQGPQGSKGDKGDPGMDGATGARGPAGATGTRGLKGDKGDTGATGAMGNMGNTGAMGTKGDMGDPGTPGTPGTPGAPGAGVDQVTTARNTADNATVVTFLVDGVTLTETATIPDGSQGPAGAMGAMGSQGMTGAEGQAVDGLAVTRTGTNQVLTFSAGSNQLSPTVTVPDGVQGATGATGPAGTMGSQGTAGIGITSITVTTPVAGQPSTGTINYSDSTTGTFMVPAGAMGAMGSTGMTGSAGAPGAGIDNVTATRAAGVTSTTLEFFVGGTSVGTATIPDGATGPAGMDGARGPIGPQGHDGQQGIPGHGIDGVDSERNATDDATIVRFRANGTYIPESVTILDSEIRGPMGLPGMDGAIGPKGDKGDTGPQGPIGPQGPAGLDGTGDISVWSATETYPIGSYVIFNGALYTNRIELSPTTDDPATDTDNWYFASEPTVYRSQFNSIASITFVLGTTFIDDLDPNNIGIYRQSSPTNQSFDPTNSNWKRIDNQPDMSGTVINNQDAPTGMVATDDVLMATVDGTDFYWDARSYALPPLTAENIAITFNIGSTPPNLVNRTTVVSGGQAPYTYTFVPTAQGTITPVGNNQAEYSVMGSLINTRSVTMTALDTINVTDSLSNTSIIDVDYTIVDNRGFRYLNDTGDFSRFATGSWIGNLEAINLSDQPVFVTSFSNGTISTLVGNDTRRTASVTVPRFEFATGTQSVELVITDTRSNIISPTTRFRVSRTVNVYTPGAFYGSGDIPTLQAQVLTGTEIRTVTPGTTEVPFLNAASGNNWVALTNMDATFEAFVGGSFMPVDGVPAPTSIQLQAENGSAEDYYIYDLGGVGPAGSTLRVRIAS